MSKRNAVSYVKPEEPSFLREIKERAGYREGPTVDTKREFSEEQEDEEAAEEREDERPTVVVLGQGDLTREEADAAAREEEQKPADLSKPIVFKAPSKGRTAGKGRDAEDKDDRKKRGSSKGGGPKEKKQKNKAPLSFDDDEEEGA